MTEQVTRVNLEALENRAEKALAKAETGWREFADAMREIKDSQAHKQAGYQYFGPYYTERWQPATGKSLRVVTGHIRGITTWESVEEVDDHRQPLAAPASYDVAARLNKIPDAQARAAFWRDHVLADKPDGRIDGNELARRVDAYVGKGVIPRMEAQGEVIPEYPSGPTQGEQAYEAASKLLSLAMDVTPEAAADSVSPGVAESVAERYEALIPWVRRFVAQLHLRTGGR